MSARYYPLDLNRLKEENKVSVHRHRLNRVSEKRREEVCSPSECAVGN